MLYLGAPIWSNKAWVGSFFPPGTKQKDFLWLYSRRLNTVEGNTTFYATPSAEIAERWRDETPPGFKFCFKFPRTITHERRLRGAEAETAEFIERLAILGDRVGPCFLQLPPTFSSADMPALLAYVDSLPPLPGIAWRLAVEVRHADFFGTPAEAALSDALRERGLARVLYDQRGLRSASPADPRTRSAQARKPDLPVRFTRTGPFAFVRYISNPDLEANGPLLDEWAAYVAAWLNAGDDVFFFCHHRNDALAPQLARQFHAHLSRLVNVPPLPDWDAQPPAKMQQASLF
jgi:uncharacterized protein YecE (DUF72 family)